ncbi:MAG TPA: bifunctional diaminohydroxyphosphoribosylaminopyrimidine deaminase/5-amino-6-(5-phosphoribosylamino)uracil reductase RibD [Actinomycetota bacterium]
MTTTSDLTFMRRALRLAERGRGRTAPNPPVGAVVVRDGRIVGEGFHAAAGGDHAEVVALAAAGHEARSATLYVTLEPCTHHGRTPPCAPAVIEAGIARVVVAARDPNPLERGAGVRALGEVGLEVLEGVLDEESRALIGGFAMLVATGRPMVTVKIASTLDGKVAAADGTSQWITGKTARRDGHRLRGWSGAVLVGVGTVLADDPALTCRLRRFSGPQPIRVVLDSSGRTPPDATVLDGSAPTLIATTPKAPEEFIAAVRARGAEAIAFPSREGRVDVASVLAQLGERGITDVLVEGGPSMVADLVERALADRFVFYLAPKLLGGLGLSGVGGLLATTVTDAPELTITSVRRVGADIKVEARPRV